MYKLANGLLAGGLETVSAPATLPMLPGIPDIPSFEDIVKDIVSFTRNGAESAVLNIVRMITHSLLPSPKQLEGNVLMFFAGGMLGLASMAAITLAVIMALFMVLTATRDHSKRISKVITSFFLLIIFQFLFLPAFAMAYDLSMGLSEAQIQLVISSPEPEDIVEKLTSDWPEDLFTAFIMFPIVSFVAFLNQISAIFISGIVLVVYLLYGMVVTLRMLGWNYPFNFFNAMMIAVLSTPPLMSFGLLLPILIGKFPIPDWAVSIVQLLTLLIGLVFAIVAPAVVFVLAYVKSNEVFGRVDATVAGKVDIGSMPFISTEQQVRHIEEANDASANSFTKAAMADALTLPVDLDYSSKGAFFQSLSKQGADVVATGLTASGHPYAAIAVKAAEKTLNRDA